MLRYLPDVTTLHLEAERCVGCAMCLAVCPQQVWRLEERRAVMSDRDACMECGACAMNCAHEAIAVRKGVGCASAIISSVFSRGAPGQGTGGCC
jgi:NAD-dependent dihydropyrimidine dehydrogenase PreA subunit